MTWNYSTPLSLLPPIFISAVRAQAWLHIGTVSVPRTCTNLAPITTAAGRAARLISVRYPLLSFFKGTFLKWKRKPRFKVRRGDLSLYALVLCRLALGFGFVCAPVAPECFLSI
jgi:hypothetical protein